MPQFAFLSPEFAFLLKSVFSMRLEASHMQASL
jgi:hypothetical protein